MNIIDVKFGLISQLEAKEFLDTQNILQLSVLKFKSTMMNPDGLQQPKRVHQIAQTPSNLERRFNPSDYYFEIYLNIIPT